MITIVIADDEKLIRAGIKKIIEKSLAIPVCIIEAKNGEEALTICKEENPDLIITDIRMPKMDGIELMKNLSALEEKPAIIVLSGFDDFSYAKEAISCGAISYILKPVDSQELITAINNAIATVNQEEKKKNEEIIKSIAEEGRIDSFDLPKNCRFDNGLCCVVGVGKKILQAFQQTLSSVSFYVLEQKRDFVSLVIPREAVYLLTSDMALQHYSIGVSSFSNHLSALRTLRTQAFIAFLQNFFSESYPNIKKEITFYNENFTLSDFSITDSKYKKCIARLDIAKTEEIKNSVDTVLDFSEFQPEKKGSLLYYCYNMFTDNLFNRFLSESANDMYLQLKSIMIENIWQFDNLTDWKQCIYDYTVYLSALLQKDTQEHPSIAKAISYMEKHFTENINMTIVANVVSVNYTWFSEKFKEHTGVNFNDYLKRMRIEEAKRLLEKGMYKTYEVAERSGFGDVKYFMKTFKTITGMTPKEYKTQVSLSNQEDN